MSKIIVCLTSIPSRFSKLKTILDSLDRQTIKPDQVDLHIPVEYRKRGFGVPDISLIPSGFNVVRCEDYGPATKILPAIKRYQGTDARIVYCDDDVTFKSNWLETLVTKSDRNPGACIAGHANYVPRMLRERTDFRRDFSYRCKRIFSLGLWKPYRIKKGRPEIAEGYGGVLVKPDFFDEKAFDIPEQVWAVDDIWLSAMLAKNGIPIIASGIKKSEISYPFGGDAPDSLVSYSHNGNDRIALNTQAIEYVMQQFGVWSGNKKYL